MQSNESYIIRTGLNGGSSVISVDPDNIKCLVIGKDNRIRVEFLNGTPSWPIIEILRADDFFCTQYEDLVAVVEGEF